MECFNKREFIVDGSDPVTFAELLNINLDGITERAEIESYCMFFIDVLFNMEINETIGNGINIANITRIK